MKISLSRKLAPKFLFVVGLASVLFWACGGGTQEEEKTPEPEPVVAPAPPEDTTKTDTAVIDTTASGKDPVPDRRRP